MDASEERTDVEGVSVLEPTAGGFRNRLGTTDAVAAEEPLVDAAQRLTLTAPAMTVPVGGLRLPGADHGGAAHGVSTARPGALTNDVFVTLPDMATAWTATGEDEQTFGGRGRATGALKWTGTRVDLVFGSSSALRAVAEVHAERGAEAKMVRGVVALTRAARACGRGRRRRSRSPPPSPSAAGRARSRRAPWRCRTGPPRARLRRTPPTRRPRPAAGAAP